MRLIQSDQQDDSLITILTIGHGDLPTGFFTSIKLIYGNAANLSFLCFDEGDDIDALGEEIGRLTRETLVGCLVLIDLFGGTPFNQLCLNLPAENCEAICGVNLIMLLQAISDRENRTLRDLAASCIQAGVKGIVSARQKLSKREKT